MNGAREDAHNNVTVLEVDSGVEYRVLTQQFKEQTIECVMDTWGWGHPVFRSESDEAVRFLSTEMCEEALASPIPGSVIAVDLKSMKVIGFILATDWASFYKRSLQAARKGNIPKGVQIYGKFKDEIYEPFRAAQDKFVGNFIIPPSFSSSLAVFFSYLAFSYFPLLSSLLSLSLFSLSLSSLSLLSLSLLSSPDI